MTEMKKTEEINILCTICARAGSKGAKGKNFRIFNGYPLVYYTLSALQGFLESYGAKYGEMVIALNTDSEALREQCKNVKLEIQHVQRKEELGGDTAAKADVICDTLIQMEQSNQKKYDVVLDLDLTSPLRRIEDIEGCLNRLLEDPLADVAFSMTEARRLPYFSMVKEDEQGYLKEVIESDFTTRQEAPACYDMNGSIYVYRREPLLRTKIKDVFKGNAVGWMMPDTAVLDIDSEEDYELMGVLAEYFYRKYPKYGRVKENIKSILKESRM